MTISQEINRLADEIEAVLRSQTYAGTNTTIPRQIRFIADRMSAHDRNAASIARKIALKAEVFYSERKHLAVPGGASLLWAEMSSVLLRQIRTQAQIRQDGDTPPRTHSMSSLSTLFYAASRIRTYGLPCSYRTLLTDH